MPGKILHLIGQMVRGGAERQLLHVCTELAERGWPQAVVTFRPGSPWDHLLMAKGIPLFNVPPSRLKLARLMRLLLIIARERPALVHSWSHHTNVYAGHAHRFLGFRFIASLRHNPLFDNQTGRNLAVMPHAATYARADCVLSNSCVSLGMARAAGLRPKSEVLVGNIVSPQVAGSPGLTTNCPNILTVGNLTELKGHEDLFRALRILTDDKLDFRLQIVGDGPKRRFLETLAAELRLRNRVEFLGELDDLNQILPRCQLMVHPSRMEGLSNAVLEGMASGLAVCATAVGATPEYVEDGITGSLVPPYSPSILASRLRELLLSPALRSRLGLAAHAKVTANCSPATVVEQYENCYESLLEPPRRNGGRAIRQRSPGTKILMYHNLLEHPCPGIPVAGHQATVDGFRSQMLAVRNRVVHPSKVHEAIANGGRLPEGILVTFDDGASGLLRASEILAELGLSGVAFICPGALKSGLWFYRLADALARTQCQSVAWRGMRLSVVSAQAKMETYRLLYPILASELTQIREASLKDLLDHLQPSGKSCEGLRILDEPDIRRVAANGSLYFANHTWSHPNLIALPQEEIRTEIKLASHWLQSSKLPTLPWFAFPQGHYDRRVLNVAESEGLVPFGAETANSFQEVFTRIGVYGMDSNLARFRLKLLLKPAC